jgi:hypothetical protein
MKVIRLIFPIYRNLLGFPIGMLLLMKFKIDLRNLSIGILNLMFLRICNVCILSVEQVSSMIGVEVIIAMGLIRIAWDYLSNYSWVKYLKIPLGKQTKDNNINNQIFFHSMFLRDKIGLYIILSLKIEFNNSRKFKIIHLKCSKSRFLNRDWSIQLNHKFCKDRPKYLRFLFNLEHRFKL